MVKCRLNDDFLHQLTSIDGEIPLKPDRVGASKLSAKHKFWKGHEKNPHFVLNNRLFVRHLQAHDKTQKIRPLNTTR